MTRSRRLTIVATGMALTAAASLGAASARADTAPATALRTDYILCTGLDGVSGACVEDPASTISELPRVRQVVYDLTGIG